MRLIIIGVVLLLGPGCSRYRDPLFRVSAVTVGEMTDEALQLHFDLRLTNPNNDPLQLVQFDYTVSVEGRRVFQGRRAAEATLNVLVTRTLTIPAVVPYDRMGWVESGPPPTFGYRLSGTLLYLTPGELAETLLDTGLRRPKVRFAHAGEVVTMPGGDGTVLALPASDN